MLINSHFGGMCSSVHKHPGPQDPGVGAQFEIDCARLATVVIGIEHMLTVLYKHFSSHGDT